MTCLDLSQWLKPFRWLTQGHKAVVVPIMEHVICMLHITCSKMTKSYLEEKIWIFYTCIIFRVWSFLNFNSVQFSSVAQSCPTLCDPMNHGMPGLPVHHQLLEFTQTHVHRVSDAIQPSHSLSSPFPPAPNPSQHQGLFQWVKSSHKVAKVLEFQLHHLSFQWTPRTDLL